MWFILGMVMGVVARETWVAVLDSKTRKQRPVKVKGASEARKSAEGAYHAALERPVSTQVACDRTKRIGRLKEGLEDLSTRVDGFSGMTALLTKMEIERLLSSSIDSNGWVLYAERVFEILKARVEKLEAGEKEASTEEPPTDN